MCLLRNRLWLPQLRCRKNGVTLLRNTILFPLGKRLPTPCTTMRIRPIQCSTFCQSKSRTNFIMYLYSIRCSKKNWKNIGTTSSHGCTNAWKTTSPILLCASKIDEAFTPEERFAKMRRQNAHFDALSQQLGLELK